MGFGVLELFVEQNASALAAFMTRWWEQVQGHLSKLQTETTDSSETMTAPEAEPEMEPSDESESWSG